MGGALAGGRVGPDFEVNGVRAGGGAGKACRHHEPIGVGGERVGGAVLVVEDEGQCGGRLVAVGSADEDCLFRLRIVLRSGVLYVQVRVLDDGEVEGLDVLGGRCDAHLHLAHAVAGVGSEVENEFRGHLRFVAGRKLAGGGVDVQVVGVVGVAILQIDVPTVGGCEREGVGGLVGIEVERV